MKVCTFCGCKTDDKTKNCASCGSQDFMFVCPNCSNQYTGKFCPSCGTKRGAVAKECPECGTKYFSRSCPNCGYNESRRQTNRASATSGYVVGTANKNTVIALAISIIGITTFMFPLPIISLILGIKEYKDIKAGKVQTNPRNDRMLITALTISGISLAISIIWLIVILTSTAYVAIKG